METTIHKRLPKCRLAIGLEDHRMYVVDDDGNIALVSNVDMISWSLHGNTSYNLGVPEISSTSIDLNVRDIDILTREQIADRTNRQVNIFALWE